MIEYLIERGKYLRILSSYTFGIYPNSYRLGTLPQHALACFDILATFQAFKD